VLLLKNDGHRPYGFRACASAHPGMTNVRALMIAGPLWDSYNIAIATVSKTYAPGGTSTPDRAESITTARITSHRSAQMWDVVMITLGLGFFAAAIGYTYGCERL
jgi:hypothetical protein